MRAYDLMNALMTSPGSSPSSLQAWMKLLNSDFLSPGGIKFISWKTCMGFRFSLWMIFFKFLSDGVAKVLLFS